MPGGSRAFEQVARFCYKRCWIEVRPDNVALLRSVAEYLEMTEEFGAGNLIEYTEVFLSTISNWSWKDIITLLHSCETLLPLAEKFGIIQLCVDSLALKAKSHDYCTFSSPNSNDSSNACSMSASPKSLSLNQTSGSSKLGRDSSHLSYLSLNANRSPSSPCSLDPCCTISPHCNLNSRNHHCHFKQNWWCEDMSSLSTYMMERLISALETYSIEHKYIAKILLKYLEASLPLLGYSPLSVISEAGDMNGKRFKDYSQRVQKEVLQTVVCLLYRLDWIAIPMKSLFELRRVSTVIGASHSCKGQVEEMIGSQLHMATLDNILVPRVKHRDRRYSCLYDVDLVLRLVRCFLHVKATKDLQAKTEGSNDIEVLPKMAIGYGGSVQSNQLETVGILIDKYLTEIAPDSLLKASKFSELAEALPSNARETHDGLYRALDIYLQAHPSISKKDASQICKAIDLAKLSFEACKHVMQNPRIPAWLSFQVLASQQEKLRTAIGSSRLQCSEWRYPEDNKACPIMAVKYTSVIRQNERLRSDLRSMQSKINELERLCKGMRSHMSHDVWLTC
ncbi:hypothetical protein KP509_17G061300 [Ceratopteris richardii]|nr:hypothetical protein KP509_17G061300 [Ceratopteris richardii]